MFRFFSKNKQKIVDDAVGGATQQLKDVGVSRSIDENITAIKELFTDVDILRLRRIENNHSKRLKYCIVYCDGVVDAAIINENIIKPLMLSDAAEPGKDLIDTLMNHVLQVNDIQKTDNLASIIDGISYGDTVLFIDGSAQAVILMTKSFTQRAVTEPQNEKALSGPHEGFTEALVTNLSLIRRKVRTHELKMKFHTFGKRTQTKVCVCYMEGIVNTHILKELYRRLERIKIDAVLDSNYLMEFIRDVRLSPFRTIGYTERPDVVIGKLLEGRIAVIVDGSPSVLTLPYLFIENFQSSEDYYLSFYYTSFSRMLRMLGFFLTVVVPGLYIAIGAFHQEMFPTPLLINIATERQSAPLPAALEAFIMVIIFDILRETGVRMPTNIGQALSIVGALVIGQAAVEAELIAAPMVIIVAITGITSLLVPKLNAPVIYIRLGLLLLASMFGFYGLGIGISFVLLHIINLHSFGVPQVSFIGNLKYREIKDTFYRAPWWRMRQRPKMAANKTRIKIGGNGND